MNLPGGSAVEPVEWGWRDGVPWSPRFGDVYHSVDGAPGQAWHVFLQGCGLPGAWRDRRGFTILETGFGTGTNFLVTWANWQDDPTRPASLDYIAFEKHPFTAGDLAALHVRHARLLPLARQLAARWPLPVSGVHQLDFEAGRVRLTLVLGDAVEWVDEIEARVDAFYLDGFAPERNPTLWQADFLARLARLGKPGARAATYTVAAPVRAALGQAGFVCERRPGFGRKRHCLAAYLAGEPVGEVRVPRTVAVVGAGVAGCAVAHALAQRGIEVTVLDAAATPATGASGNPVAVFRPHLTRARTAASALTEAAYLFNLTHWPDVPGVDWAQPGVLQLARDARHAAQLHGALDRLGDLPAYAYWVEAETASARAGWPISEGGVFMPRAGWVAPPSLCGGWLAHPGIQFRGHTRVQHMVRSDAGWQLADASGRVCAEADAVVVAAAWASPGLVCTPGLPLSRVRGQVSGLPSHSLKGLRAVVAREGYVVPGLRAWVGATYEHGDAPLEPTADGHRANLARLGRILPGAAEHIDAASCAGRAAWRATLPDRLPAVGSMGEPGLYVAAGYASRGVVWAGVLGAWLAAEICHTPRPLGRTLASAIVPLRFAQAAPSIPPGRGATD